MEEPGSASKLHIQIPDHVWVSKVSRQFPHHVFEFDSAVPIRNGDKVCNNIFKIKGSNVQQCITWIAQDPAIISHFVLDSTPTEMLCMIQSNQHEILYLLIEFRIAIQFPIIVQNGHVTITILGARDQIDAFLTELSRHHLSYSIDRIGSYQKETFLQGLTPRQIEIFHLAKTFGYYESPRKITLSALA